MSASTLGAVAITGVTGFVGRALARSLVESGVELRGYSRDPQAASRDVPGLRVAAAWTKSGALDAQPLVGAHAVVHLAGENVGNAPWTAARKKEIEASRIDGTRRLVEAIASVAETLRPRVLVSASAIGFYGDTGDREVDETSPKGEGFLSDVCDGWEREARKAEALGVRVVIVRIGVVLGLRGGALGKMLPLYKAGLGGPMGPGTQWWSWVHLDDAVGVLRFAIENDSVRGVVAASSPGLLTQADFSRVLAKVVRRPAFIPAPAFAIRTALGDFADELLESRRVTPRRTQALGYHFRYPELEGALRALLA